MDPILSNKEDRVILKTIRRRDIHKGDRFFLWVLRTLSFSIFALLLCIGIFLYMGAQPAISHFGFDFITSSVWDPVRENFGALPVIFGTLLSSGIAILFAVPISVGVALFLNELAPTRIAAIVGFLIEMLAAVPSVVYGLWGIFVLVPFLRTAVQPFLSSYFGFIPLFNGPPLGVGTLAAGIILAIMITPTISTICREVFKTIPRYQKEAARALGASRWETIRIAVLKSSKNGIFGAIFLGLGRALGETMAVTMVIGNRASISASLFAPAQTMASVIANEYIEAMSDMHLAALAEVGLLLFLITLLVNALARFIVWRGQTRWSNGSKKSI